MKTKIHKLLGVALTAILLVTMTIGLVAVPASAGTLSWSTESLPSPGGAKLVACDVIDFAVAYDGVTIYAGIGTTTMYKSTNGGASWTPITGLAGDADLMAVAPDDANIVAYADTATQKVYASTNGGTSFSDLGQVGTVALTAIYDIDISPTSAGVHNIAACGTSATPEAVTYFNLGASVPKWTDMHGWLTLDADTAVRAIKFSPAFASDKVMVAVTEVGTDVHFEIASFASKKWNNDAGFADYTLAGHLIGTAGIAPLNSASIVLLPTYLGADEVERKGFVGLASAGLTGGIYRMSDEADTSIKSANIHSIDYVAGEKLVAGDYASNIVYRSANPLAVSPTVPGTSVYQRPGGTGVVIAAFAGDTVVAGTSGDESAFAVSNDDGATFNDVSLIDTVITTIEDFAVSADGSKIYLLTNDGTTTATASENDLSLWRYVSSWERILNLPINDGATAYNAYNIVRIAPEDAAVVYVADQGGTTLYYSADEGEAKWTLRAATSNIQDVAVESASVLYALTTTGSVHKTTNAGFIWGPPVATGLGTGFSIASLGEDNLIVGGAAGNVAYSTDGSASATTWTKILPTMATGTGNVQVTATGLATGDNIYAGVSTVNDYLYRWTIGTNTSAWTKIISAALGTNEYCSDIGLSGAVLYALVHDATAASSTLYRNLVPFVTPTPPPFNTVATTADFATTPQALSITTGSVKLWAIDTDAGAAEETGDSATVTNDELYSYTDTLTAAGPTLTAPADGSTIAMNPVTGRAYDVAFNWGRLSTATSYSLKVALDSGFTQVVRSETVASTSSKVVQILGPFTAGPSGFTLELMPETTYYWKVSAGAPVSSPSSGVWSFTIAPAVEPPAPPAPVLEPELLAPAHGATDVSVFPTFAWSGIEGAVKYELEVAKDAAFAEKWVSKSGRNALTTTAYVSEQQLEYATTYYWRVDCYADGEWGNWVTGIFTTEAAPVTPVPEMHTCPLCGLEFPTQQALADHYAQYHAPAPPTAETPIYMWVIIGIGAILVITMIILIVRTRRAV